MTVTLQDVQNWTNSVNPVGARDPLLWGMAYVATYGELPPSLGAFQSFQNLIFHITSGLDCYPTDVILFYTAENHIWPEDLSVFQQWAHLQGYTGCLPAVWPSGLAASGYALGTAATVNGATVPGADSQRVIPSGSSAPAAPSSSATTSISSLSSSLGVPTPSTSARSSGVSVGSSSGITGWIEQHPIESIIGTVVGVYVLGRVIR